MDYHNKYIKYKNKYLLLKKQNAGAGFFNRYSLFDNLLPTNYSAKLSKSPPVLSKSLPKPPKPPKPPPKPPKPPKSPTTSSTDSNKLNEYVQLLKIKETLSKYLADIKAMKKEKKKEESTLNTHNRHLQTLIYKLGICNRKLVEKIKKINNLTLSHTNKRIKVFDTIILENVITDIIKNKPNDYIIKYREYINKYRGYINAIDTSITNFNSTYTIEDQYKKYLLKISKIIKYIINNIIKDLLITIININKSEATINQLTNDIIKKENDITKL